MDFWLWFSLILSLAEVSSIFTVQLQPKLCPLTSMSLCGPGTKRTAVGVSIWQWDGLSQCEAGQWIAGH